MNRLAGLLALLCCLALPSAASAFCGFYVAGGDTKLFNDATQVVMMRNAKTTVLSMQNNYEGPTEDFAMVVPVPQVLQKKNVKTLDKVVFDRVDQLSAPRLVEYWERNPCQPTNLLGARATGGFGGLGLQGYGRGGGGIGGMVKVEAKFKVGEYDIVILSTNDSSALEGWLKDNKYNIPTGAEPYFKPYVAKGSYFFVAKVDAKRVKYEDGKAVLSPLRFHYESDEFSLPIRLGMINSKGEQDLLVYILADNQRYEVANYPNVTIPTNIEVGTNVRDSFGEFYEALFSRTVEENPKAVVTEYSWAATSCDPCPTGLLGGSGLTPQDLMSLGNDVVKVSQGWNQAGWTLTRLHARYGPDDIGEDLVFQKAPAIVGGREIFKGDSRELERGAQPSSSGNNFQGRYVMRHEWEGDVACDEPQRGIWGGPPDPYGMSLIADTVVAELRRQAAAAQGREPTAEELAAPRTAAEEAAIAYHIRKKFGTSVAPLSAQAGPATAPSANTRGGALGKGLKLANYLKEPIPSLKVQPIAPPAVDTTSAAANGTTAGGAATADQVPGPPPVKDSPPQGKGCSSTGANPGLASLLLMALVMALALVGRRRRR